MASPNGIATLPRIKPGRRGSLSQLVGIQHVIWEKIHDPKATGHSVAALARAWCCVEETKRIVRGRFAPGQMRPSDLDPAALAKMAKVARKRSSKVLPWTGGPTFDWDGPPAPAAHQSNGAPPAVDGD